MATDWGRIIVGTRLEKQVSAQFVQVWSALVTQGLRRGDGYLITRGYVAHKAANDLVRRFLATDADTLMFLDSDADIDADFLERFRSDERGWEYDILQAFYPRRGWPPRAIWMQRNPLGQMVEVFILDPDTVQDVDIAGTHACLIRRRVFEGLLGDNDPETFEWFYYPRHLNHSEDGAFSIEAKQAGYRIGATTHVKAGHISELTTSWDSYIDYLNHTGRIPLIYRYDALAKEVAAFTGEPPEMVIAKAIEGPRLVREAWSRANPETPEEERAFYGSPDSGYLYDLLNWNCQPAYEQIIAPLYGVEGKHVLVIGAGLGTEAEILARRNQVDAFELPGALRDFARKRLGAQAWWLEGDRLSEAVEDYPAVYDLIVAIDTLEHVHPDEIESVLAAIEYALAPGGTLYAHNTWQQTDKYPMHRDHSAVFEAWLARHGFKQTGEYQWQG